MNNDKLTILYERLSHEDGRENESLSIEHQKEYLEEYAARNGFTNLEKTVLTEHSRRILDELTARNAAAAPAQGAGTAARGNTQPAAKVAPTVHEGGADGSRNGDAAQG